MDEEFEKAKELCQKSMSLCFVDVLPLVLI